MDADLEEQAMGRNEAQKTQKKKIAAFATLAPLALKNPPAQFPFSCLKDLNFNPLTRLYAELLKPKSERSCVLANCESGTKPVSEWSCTFHCASLASESARFASPDD